MSARKAISVVGAGQIGRVIATMLADQGHVVTLMDKVNGNAIDNVRSLAVDAADVDALSRALAGQDIVVSACPYFLNKQIAQAARNSGTHYFDLTEDVETTAHIRRLAQDADVAFMPQCGLAPGFVCVLGAEIASRFQSLRSIKMRVGALPLFPTNALRYNVTWSVDGLINEYCNPCEMILHGGRTLVPPLEGVESVMIDGVAYEAFNTSGGLGTLTETFEGRISEMSYKTLRYPGHSEIMKLLLEGLMLRDDRDTLRRILSHAAPFTTRDVVVVFVTGVGVRDGRTEEESIVLRYDGIPHLSAIQMTTACGCVAMVEMFIKGSLPARGFLRQEDAKLADFLDTRAGGRLAQDSRGFSCIAPNVASAGRRNAPTEAAA